MKSKIWLSSPHMGGGEMKFIEQAFSSNWIAPLGPNVSGFEKDLENYLGENSKIACLSSGTAAIHLALILLGVVKDDEVLCQSFTFSATTNPILYQGAKPIFIDSESTTWNMCPKALEDAIKDRISKGKKPKAIIFVHLYGMPAQIDKIQLVAKKFGIPLIEDAAEALGSTYKGQKCGTFGDFGILSFNGNKIITTSGGGALVCKTSEQKEKAIFLSTQARDKAAHYQHSKLGYNYRMSNILAGIGRGQMEILDKHISLRRKNNDFYKDLFKDSKVVNVFSETSGDFFSNKWLSCITIDESKASFSREDIRTQLEQDNIESRPLWKPMHMQPLYQKDIFYGSHISEDLFKFGLCLPSGSNLSDDHRKRIGKVLSKFTE